MKSYIALFLSILIGAAGQLSLKAGALHNVEKHQFFSPYVVLGLGLYFAAAILYIYSLKAIPLSVAFPSVSFSYIVIALAAHHIWGEPFGVHQIAALLLISTGLFLLHRH